MLARRRVQPGILPVPALRQVFAPLTVEDNLQLEALAHGPRDSLARIFMLAAVGENKPRQLGGNP
jgi:ABC-type branched-subunit amino acid transport system ATPase component